MKDIKIKNKVLGNVKLEEITKDKYIAKIMTLTFKAKNYLDDLVKMAVNYTEDDLPEFMGCGIDLIEKFEVQDDLWLDQKCNYSRYISPVYKALNPELPKLGKFSFKTGELAEPSFVVQWLDGIAMCGNIILTNMDALKQAYNENFSYFVTDTGLPVAMENELIKELEETPSKPSNAHTYV